MGSVPATAPLRGTRAVPHPPSAEGTLREHRGVLGDPLQGRGYEGSEWLWVSRQQQAVSHSCIARHGGFWIKSREETAVAQAGDLGSRKGGALSVDRGAEQPGASWSYGGKGGGTGCHLTLGAEPCSGGDVLVTQNICHSVWWQ